MNGFYIYIQWTYNLLKCQTAGSEKNSYWLWFYPTLSGLIGNDFHMLIHMTLCQDNRTMYRASNLRFFWYIVSTGIFIFSQSWSWHMCCFNSCDVSKLWGLGATVNVPMLMWINKINTVPLGAVLMCFLCTLYWCIIYVTFLILFWRKYGYYCSLHVKTAPQSACMFKVLFIKETLHSELGGWDER